MSKETIKIIREVHRSENRNWINKIRLQAKQDIIYALFGLPIVKYNIGVTLYYWEEREVKLIVEGFGFFIIESNENGIAWFVDFLVNQAARHNEIVKKLIYRVDEESSWRKINQFIPNKRLIDYIDCIKLIDKSTTKQIINKWEF